MSGSKKDLPRLDPTAIELEALDVDPDDDRRRAPRTPTDLVVHVRIDGASHFCQADDLSRNGIRIHPPPVEPEVGMAISLELKLPEQLKAIVIEAEFATTAGGLWGLHFLDIAPEDAEAIDDFALANGWML